MKKPKPISPRKARRLQALAWLASRCTEGKKQQRIFRHLAREHGLTLLGSQIDDIVYLVLRGLPGEVLDMVDALAPMPPAKGEPFHALRNRSRSPFLRLYFEILSRFHERDLEKALAAMSADLREIMLACTGLINAEEGEDNPDSVQKKNMELIREIYRVPAEIAGRVRYRGNEKGTITGTNGLNLLILMDGEEVSRSYHPVFFIEYLPS